MKKALALLLCIFVCLSFVACGNSENEIAPTGMKLASDKEVPDYKLFVPEAWTVETSTGTTTACLRNTSGETLATFVASFAEVADGITLDNYFESFSIEFSDVFKNPENVTEDDITLSGKAAKRYTYTMVYGDVEYKFQQVICIRENRVYTLTYSSTTEKFDDHVEDMTLILSNFKFTK